MNFRLTLTLAVVMLGLVITWTLYRTMPAPKPPETSTNGGTPFIATKPKSLSAITLIANGKEELKFARDGDKWQMIKPYKGATSSSFFGVPDTLLNAVWTKKFDPDSPGHSPRETGIESPYRTIKFTDDAGKEYTMAFGKEAVEGFYVKFNNDKDIYLVDKNILSSLDKKPDLFRDKAMNRADSDKVVAIRITTEDGAVALDKTDGKWLVTRPVIARAKAAMVEEIVSGMCNLTAEDFSKLTRADVSLNQPRATVSIDVLKEGAPPASAPASSSQPSTTSKPAVNTVTVEFGGKKSLAMEASPVFAAMAGSDSVFTLSNDSYTKLARSLKEIRDANVTPAPVASATEMTVIDDKGATTVAAAYKDKKWVLTNPALAGDTAEIQDFLGHVQGLVATDFVDAGDLKSLGLDPPQRKMEFTVPGQAQHEVILFGKPTTDPKGGKLTPVQRQGEAPVFMVRTDDVERTKVNPLLLRDKEIERVNANNVRSMVITGPGATGTAKGGTTLSREGFKWTAKSGDASITPDDGKVTALLADFTPLAASKYYDMTVPTGTPEVTLTMTLVESATPPATATAPATTPATATAPATTATSAPATSAPTTAATSATSKPTTMAASAPTSTAPAMPLGMGPDMGKTVTRTLRLYKEIKLPETAPATATAPATSPATTQADTAPATAAAPATATAPAQPTIVWKAVWDNQNPAWAFQPTAALIDHLTKENYLTVPPTQPATTTAPAPEIPPLTPGAAPLLPGP